jgi:hypothetical protein
MAVYRDKRGYFLRIYDGRARDIIPPVHLDLAVYGHDVDGAPWSDGTWRSWLREGAERLLYRVGILRFALTAPMPEPGDAEPVLADEAPWTYRA